MIPKDYLQQYAELFQPSKVKFGFNDANLMVEQGYYYPPCLQQETYLDTLSRTDLLKMMERILVTEYTQQRFVRRQVDDYFDVLQKLKNERAWRQAEMERLDGELTKCMHGTAILEVERNRLESLASEYQQELHNSRRSCQNRIMSLENECANLHTEVADLRSSTSWKITAPLRFVSRIIRNKLLKIQ